jgi:polar amino acid transport system permease protein
MTHRAARRRPLRAAALLIAAAVVLVPAVLALVRPPAAAAATGSGPVLRVGSDLTYPPYAYLDGGAPAGFEVEFMQAVGRRLDRPVEFVDTRFEQLIPQLRAGGFEVIASALYVTEARAAQVTYVPHLTTGNSIVVRSGGAAYADPAALCGHTVGVIKGGDVTNQLRSAPCPGSPIDVRDFGTDSEATQALLAGQLDAQVTDAAVARSVVDARHGALRISSTGLLYPIPVGLAVAKGNTALAGQIEGAIAALRSDGSYQALLDRYNLAPPDDAAVAKALGTQAPASSAPTFDWAYVAGLFADPDFYRAALVVVALAVTGWAIAVLLGMGVALAMLAQSPLLRRVATTYVWFFRSLPLLVLLIFVYNAPLLVPALRPIIGVPFIAGLVAIVLSETAYIAEIHRGGLQSVASGQGEAARALGVRWRDVQRRVVVPQAFRIALPALGNQLVTIIKLTSLVSAISLSELLLVGQRLYTQNFKVLETLLAVALYYVALVTVFDLGLRALERRLDVRRRHAVAVAQADDTGALPEPAARAHVPHAGEVVLDVRGVVVEYGSTRMLDGIDLAVHRGEVVALIGPSGSGKTTLVRSLNAMAPISGGDVLFHGEPVGYRRTGDGSVHRIGDTALAGQREQIGMVFQQFNLFPHMTVLENVTFAPRTLHRVDPVDAERQARELLGKVGMATHAAKYPHQLSGGQQQRVAIARALAMDPEVVLFDEPTSALDPELVGEVLQVMTELATEGLTMVVVTHEMRFAREVADWVVVLDNGRAVEQGPADEVFGNPSTERTRKFLDRVTVA